MPVEISEAASHRGPAALLQRGSGDRADRGRLPRRAARTPTIYVYDNNSTDRTREVAAEAGAIVRTERMQGKGHVVRRMFADVEADIYVMADGDATYDAAAAPALVAKLLDEQLDMVVGARKSEVEEAYRRGHALGNRLFTGLLASLFGRTFSDIFSGYRVFSRRFVKILPGACRAASRPRPRSASTRSSSPCRSARSVTAYGARPEGSDSKLSTYRDGWRILKTILHLYRIERPVLFYGSFAPVPGGARHRPRGPARASPILETGLVPRFPTAILATGLMILAFLSFFAGLILDTVVRGRREVRRLHYLSLPAPGAALTPMTDDCHRYLQPTAPSTMRRRRLERTVDFGSSRSAAASRGADALWRARSRRRLRGPPTATPPHFMELVEQRDCNTKQRSRIRTLMIRTRFASRLPSGYRQCATRSQSWRATL